LRGKLLSRCQGRFGKKEKKTENVKRKAIDTGRKMDVRKRRNKKKRTDTQRLAPAPNKEVKRRSVGSVAASWTTLFDAAVVALVPQVTSAATCQMVATQYALPPHLALALRFFFL
jgi:hypothetical protein